MLSPLPYECPPELIARALVDRSGGAKPIPTAIAGAAGELALESAKRATESGLIEPILVGDRNEIAALAERLGWDIAPFRLVEAASAEAAVAEAVALVLAFGASKLLGKLLESGVQA